MGFCTLESSRQHCLSDGLSAALELARAGQLWKLKVRSYALGKAPVLQPPPPIPHTSNARTHIQHMIIEHMLQLSYMPYITSRQLSAGFNRA